MGDARLERLEAIVRATGGCLVGFSGGVDSTFLLAVARRVLGERAVAVTVRTILQERADLENARRRAALLGAAHETIELDLEGHPEVIANSPDRCYHCKRLVFSALLRRAEELGLPTLVDATQADDLRERRPGARALRELGVASPLAAAGLTKADIRRLSPALGIADADRPSSPCLATRIPYGTPLTVARLRRVAGAEYILRELGFTNIRVRDYGQLARIELEAGELERAVAGPLRRGILGPLRDLGYRYVTLDLAGYRSGSMDEVLEGGDLPEPGCKTGGVFNDGGV